MSRLSHRLHSWIDYLLDTSLLVAAGGAIGAAVSLFEVLFSYGLRMVSAFRMESGGSLWLLTLPPVGVLIVWLFSRFGHKSKQGISLVFKINQGRERWIPKRTITLMTLTTWLSHLAGASVGKEGVGMQIGATVSHVISRNIPRFSNERSVFLITGMAAGFAGLFGTPLTAVFFSMEVLVSGVIEFRAMPSCIAAAFSASELSKRLGVSREEFLLPVDPLHFDPIAQGWKIVLLGLVFGAAGAVFAWSMKTAHGVFKAWAPNPYQRILLGSAGVGLLLWLCMDGRYSGSGTNLIQAAFLGGQLYPWDFALKYALSVLSLSIGFIGGEVTPLFAIGTTLGWFLGPTVGLPGALGAALGYAAVFGAGTNTWLAPMMIGMEVFGYAWFPAFFLVSSTAYLVNGNLSIYTLQRRLESVYRKEDCEPGSSSLSLQAVPQPAGFEPSAEKQTESIQNDAASRK